MALDDEILAALPALIKEAPEGATPGAVSGYLACKTEDARRAMVRLDGAGRAIYLRYPGSKARILVPADFELDPGFAVCGECRVIFEQPKKRKRICCGRSCGIKWSWKQPGTYERRLAAVRLSKKTPEATAHALAHNKKRWSRPGEREKLAEWNRQRWADPATKAKLSAAIQAVNGSPEARAQSSRQFKAWWSDPENRERGRAAIQAGKNTPEYKAFFSEMMKARWRDPIMREKYTAANRARNAAKSEAARKKKQTRGA